MYDSIVIGAGPAGLTASIFLRRSNKKVLVLEANYYGGQIINTPKIENYPAFENISGFDFATKIYNQAKNFGVEIVFERAVEIKNYDDYKEVVTNKKTYQTKTIILATGSDNRHLNIEREKELLGKGVSYCATCDGAFYKGKNVAVIGGANTAVTNALYMSNLCPKVYLIYRGSKLKCEKVLLDSLKEKSNIEVIYNSNVKEIIGNRVLESIVLDNGQELKISGMFISIGMDAQTKLVKNLLPLSEQNYVLSDDCSTIKTSIFVAGDCRHKTIRQLTTAMSDGAVAASFAIKYLENNQ